MATKYAKHHNPKPKATPQNEPIGGREADMVANNAGGFAFKLDRWEQARRFLILGTEGGTFYVDEKQLSKDNAVNLLACLKQDGVKLVDMIQAVSHGGKSYRNDACLYALALVFAAGSNEAKLHAITYFRDIVRIGTHLHTFTEYVTAMRGWGRRLREAVQSWYLKPEPRDLAYQLIKYRQRGGWAHRDIIRLAHPKSNDPTRNMLLNYAVERHEWSGIGDEQLRLYIYTAEQLRTDMGITPNDAAKLIRHFNMPRETLRTELLNSKVVWEALLENMPVTAMIRNLPKMTAMGMLTPLSGNLKHVTDTLRDKAILRKGRVHPMQILAALATYKEGHGTAANKRENALVWTPVRDIVDVLDEAFYMTFDNVEPMGGNIMLSLDVSGSMAQHEIAKIPGLTPRMASAALAMVTARTEPNKVINAFTCAKDGSFGGQWSSSQATMTELDISPRQRLDDVINTTAALKMGGTDCALPMLSAIEKGYHINLFVIYTDNETWAGRIHPAQALAEYRKKFNPHARLVVVGMVSTGFSIADPKDPGMFDVVGMSTDTPSMIAQFGRGEL